MDLLKELLQLLTRIALAYLMNEAGSNCPLDVLQDK